MTTSFLDEQRDRLETLLNDLSVRQQQNGVPPSEFLLPSQRALGGSAAPPSSHRSVESAEPSSFKG
jgi:hypothetical protein